MWILYLNDMRSSKIEALTPVARAETREALEALIQRETVKHYRDAHWGKSFRQGGPLEWCNPLELSGRIVDVGTEEKWANDARRRFEMTQETVPDVETLS